MALADKCIHCLILVHSLSSQNMTGSSVLSVLSLLCSLQQDLIKKIILTTTGFDVVNRAVRARLIDELTVLLRGRKLGLIQQSVSIY